MEMAKLMKRKFLSLVVFLYLSLLLFVSLMVSYRRRRRCPFWFLKYQYPQNLNDSVKGWVFVEQNLIIMLTDFWKLKFMTLHQNICHKCGATKQSISKNSSFRLCFFWWFTLFGYWKRVANAVLSFCRHSIISIEIAE